MPELRIPLFRAIAAQVNMTNKPTLAPVTMTGDVSGKYNAKYFNVTFPRDYVAHVEINRAEKLNAFYQP